MTSKKEEEEQDSPLEIDIRLFPSNVYYKILGVEYIIERHKLLRDDTMLPLYEYLAQQMKSPGEEWDELSKPKLPQQ